MVPTVFTKRAFETEVRGTEGALMSLYLPNGAYVLGSAVDGMGLPSGDSWCVCAYPGNFDSDFNNLPFQARSSDENPLQVDDAVEKAIAIAAALPAYNHLKSVEITRMLVLSTSHLTDRTCNSFLPEYPLAFEKREYGYFVNLPDPKDLADRKIPEDLMACMAYAKSLGCDWLMLDRDGNTVADLPTFDW